MRGSNPTVPIGSGLSSSAALEVSVLRALRLAFHLPLDDVALAIVARRGENDFVGAPVGIMDPMAASLADERTALFLDTRTLRYERISLPPETELAIVDSGIAHAHCAGNTACARLSARGPVSYWVSRRFAMFPRLSSRAWRRFPRRSTGGRAT